MLKTGKTGTSKTVVTEKNTAKAVGSGSLNVFATPMMIALMEEAACDCLSDSLEQGQTSVGTQISVDHTAASSLNKEITAIAEITSTDGKKIVFDVVAMCCDVKIGSGTHTRFIVDAKRFMERTG
ncbi:MAG: thioesterase family protein [Defluviitaleaceae bacterium]|nr:thioesterase family protein [Defluviitaleaceae bacterium]